MPRANPKTWTAADADAAAARYQRTLQPEHYMEGSDQSTQRAVTLASLEVLRTRRGRVQVFNELLVMYFLKGRLRFVAPDNMARECDDPPTTKSSFSLELEPVPPFWVMEYVSPSSLRKDFRESFEKYERELKVPYYLLFRPDIRNCDCTGTPAKRTGPSRRTSPGGMKSPNGKWRSRSSAAGCGSGIGASCFSCRGNSLPN